MTTLNYPGTTQCIQQKMNDNEDAEQLNAVRDALFNQLHKRHDLRA